MDLQLETSHFVFLAVVAAYTLAAAVTDLRGRRIPNLLSVTAFGTGLIYQAVFHGWTGVGDGFGGFLIGFAPLFVLWILGSGGGGDVKLMGGLGMWLGSWLTFLVLAVTAVCVVVGTSAVLVWSLVSAGAKRTWRHYVATSQVNEARRSESPTKAKVERRVIPFAVPVAVATWIVVAWQLPKLVDSPEAGDVAPVVSAATDTEVTP